MIDRSLSTVHIIGKGRRERVLPLWEETATAVKAWSKVRPAEWGAKTYAALCSILETGRRNSRSALTAIRDALALPAAQAAGARPAHTG